MSKRKPQPQLSPSEDESRGTQRMGIGVGADPRARRPTGPPRAPVPGPPRAPVPGPPRQTTAAYPSAAQRSAPPESPPGTQRVATERMDPRATVIMAAEAVEGGPSPVQELLAPPEIEIVHHDLPEGTLDPRLVLVADPDSPRAASFRVLRHHMLEQGKPQVVAVSSARRGEGKTTCALNLALALAECGRARVLLVDANMRRPEIASALRFVPPWCFSEQLEAHRTQPLMPWTLVEIPSLWLHVLAVNPRTRDARLFDAPAFQIAIERLRLADYDHIVIDTPAVLGSADTNLIQDAADGVILTLVARRTTTRDLRTAVDQLSPTKIIGTTMFEE